MAVSSPILINSTDGHHTVELPHFNFNAACPFTEKCGSVFFSPSFTYTDEIRLELPLLQAEQPHLSQSFLLPQVLQPAIISMGLCWACSTSLSSWGARARTQHDGHILPELRREDHLPRPAGSALPKAAQTFAARARYWLAFSWSDARIPGAFSAKLLSARPPARIAVRLFLSRCMTLHCFAELGWILVSPILLQFIQFALIYHLLSN